MKNKKERGEKVKKKKSKESREKSGEKSKGKEGKRVQREWYEHITKVKSSIRIETSFSSKFKTKKYQIVISKSILIDSNVRTSTTISRAIARAIGAAWPGRE